VDVVGRFIVDQRVEPVDQPDIVDLEIVEAVVLEDLVFRVWRGVDVPVSSSVARS
jgi:hypothetical protein